MAEAADLVVVRAENRGPMTLDGTRSYVLGRTRLVLVDPGPEEPSHLNALEDAVDGREVAWILLTHAHADHSASASSAAGRFGGTVAASAETLARLGLEGRTLEDGDTLEPEPGTSIAVLECPGHSADHLCYLAQPGRRVFTGDLVLGEGSSAILHPDGGVAECLASLARLLALRPSSLLPGHGPVVEDAVGRLSQYRRHRLERERQIVAALESGASDVPALRRAVYGDLPPGLAWAAEASVAAHLAALAARGLEVPDFGAYGAREESGPERTRV